MKENIHRLIFQSLGQKKRHEPQIVTAFLADLSSRGITENLEEIKCAFVEALASFDALGFEASVEETDNDKMDPVSKIKAAVVAYLAAKKTPAASILPPIEFPALMDTEALNAVVDTLKEKIHASDEYVTALKTAIENLDTFTVKELDAICFTPKALLTHISTSEIINLSENHEGIAEDVLLHALEPLFEKTIAAYVSAGFEVQDGKIRKTGGDVDEWIVPTVLTDTQEKNTDTEEVTLSHDAWIFFDKTFLSEAMRVEVIEGLAAYNTIHPDARISEGTVVQTIKAVLSKVPIMKVKQLDSAVCTKVSSFNAIDADLFAGSLSALAEYTQKQVALLLEQCVQDAVNLSVLIAQQAGLTYDTTTGTFLKDDEVQEPQTSMSLTFLSRPQKYISEMHLMYLKDVALEMVWNALGEQWKEHLQQGEAEEMMFSLDQMLLDAYATLLETTGIVSRKDLHKSIDVHLDALSKKLPEGSHKKMFALITSVL